MYPDSRIAFAFVSWIRIWIRIRNYYKIIKNYTCRRSIYFIVFYCNPLVKKYGHWLAATRVAAKIFVFVFSRKFLEIIRFVFRKIFLQFRKIFAKHEIQICAKFSWNSQEISRNTKQEISLPSFFKNSLPKSIEKCIFSENPKWNLRTLRLEYYNT